MSIQDFLDGLEKKAKAAAEGIRWDPDVFNCEGGGNFAATRLHQYQDEEMCEDIDLEEHCAAVDAEYLKAANPATVLALVELIRAQAAVITWHESGMMKDPEGVCQRLDAALAKLEGKL